jgi:hypothetical protein
LPRDETGEYSLVRAKRQHIHSDENGITRPSETVSAFRVLSLATALLLAAGQPTVYLMPTPELLRAG